MNHFDAEDSNKNIIVCSRGDKETHNVTKGDNTPLYIDPCNKANYFHPPRSPVNRLGSQ